MNTCLPEGKKPGLSEAALGRLPGLRGEAQTRWPSSPLRPSPLIAYPWGQRNTHVSQEKNNNFQTEVNLNPFLGRADLSRPSGYTPWTLNCRKHLRQVTHQVQKCPGAGKT